MGMWNSMIQKRLFDEAKVIEAQQGEVSWEWTTKQQRASSGLRPT